MSQWYGLMNWPLSEDWVCQTCATPGIRSAGRVIAGFTWGIVHGMFICDQCHTQYTWRKGGKILARPVSLMKVDYVEAARTGWERFHKPISAWTDEMWTDLLNEEAGNVRQDAGAV